MLSFLALALLLTATAVLRKVLVGADLSEATLKAAVAALEDDLASAGGPSTDPRHSPEYRRALARSYIYKTFLQGQAVLPVALQSVLVPFVAADDRPTSKGSQVAELQG